jgi:Bacterial TSP3 repeat
VAQGLATNFFGLPPGRYVARWNPVPYFITPTSQTNTLDSDALLEFTGNYTFPDANHNGLSDTWEIQFFGSLSPTRTCATDTDGDGFPDCAEFAAGTNPTQPNSYLRLALPARVPATHQLRFQWSSTPGRIYQVQGTRDGELWVEVSNWIQATTTTTSQLIGVPDPSEPFLFRLAVRP